MNIIEHLRNNLKPVKVLFSWILWSALFTSPIDFILHHYMKDLLNPHGSFQITVLVIIRLVELFIVFLVARKIIYPYLVERSLTFYSFIKRMSSKENSI